ncbi:MAG TPA: TonB-dependent receptor, partial [Bacteroidota bacterium]
MARWFSIFSVFLLVGSSGAHAGVTGILEGTVKEKQSGQPLAGANVLIVGTEQGAATDADGFFQVPNVRAGAYQVRVSMVGYTTVTLDKVSVYPDLRTEVSVELEPTSIELQEVVVQVNPPLIQRGVTATAYAITEAKIDKLPVTNFQEVVTLQPGVTEGGNIRGGRSTEVSYLVDGLPVQDVIGGGLGTDLPKGSIVQMTVQTGGFDAEYGNAQSGVVNILTKGGDNRHRVTIRGDYDGVVPGDQTSRAADVEGLLSGPLIRDKLFYFLAQDFSFTDTRWWQDFRFYFDSPVERNYSGFAKLDYRLNPSMRLSTQVLY